MPITRDFDATFIPQIGTRVDIDLMFRFTGTHSFDDNDFFDTTRLGLDFSPSTSGRLVPAFTLRWERGQAAPVFENFDALMAGMKASSSETHSYRPAAPLPARLPKKVPSPIERPLL